MGFYLERSAIQSEGQWGDMEEKAFGRTAKRTVVFGCSAGTVLSKLAWGWCGNRSPAEIPL